MAAEPPPVRPPAPPDVPRPEEKDPEAFMQDAADKARAAADKAGLKFPGRGEAGVLVDELGEALLATLSAAQRDWLLVFTGWCRVSGKDSEGDRQRTALDMVLGMVTKCPAAFRTSEPCIVIMRNVTFPTLISTSVSQNLPVSEKSLQILFTLSKEFKEPLKLEIGVFIDEIALRILESGNSTFPHKRRALQVFCKYCEDTVSALELFLNFDCNVEEKNIFERMIDCLSKIAQGKYTDPEHSAMLSQSQEQELRMLALRALVKLMGELKEWLRKAAEASDGAGEAAARNALAGLSRAVSAQDQESASSAADGHEPQSVANARGISAPNVDDVSVCEQKQRKRDLQNGVHKFNLKPKRGLEHLRQGGFVNEKPQSVAELFNNGDFLGLDKTAIGDFLGEDKDFNKNVLESLIASLGFASAELDAALRSFLALFRLPGEAQKISRILELFAEKYCQDNPGKFSHPDCAFVLSFSLIMLQTDLHNPGVKKKMSKDDFINNNRKIDDGKDLDRSYLESLYDSIATNPMSLKEDEDAKSKLDSKAAQNSEARTKLFQKESKALAARSLELMAQRSVRRRSSVYVCARSPEHARPFFEVVCWPVLATLSVLLDMHDEQDIIKECMEGFKHCVRIAVHFEMQSQRDAIVASLAKFTYLTTIKEIKQKNLDCTKALLAIGISEGNGLGPAWKDVLHCVSQLERLQIIGDKSRQDHQYFEAEEAYGAAKSAGTPAGQALKRRATGNGMSAMVTMTAEDQQIELVNSESVAARIDKSQVEHIFERSQRLDSRAIVHFVTALKGVSKMELEIVKQPRIFALQKLVEVAMCNMSRPREVWLPIWDVLSRHFVDVAANHPNVRVGMYAIDSMKQLAKSFLEDDQLCASNLQVEFLKPFEVVMTKDRASREVRELIVSSISIVFTRIQNVRSGWKIVFNILRAAVQEPGNEAAPESAFNIMERVIEISWDFFVENFGDGVRALDAFASQGNLDIAMKATVYLQKAAQCLVSDKRLQREGSPAAGLRAVEDVADHPADTDNPLVAHWFLILRALSRLVGDPRPSLRGAGLTGVVHCLRDHGLVAFDEEMWRMVFKGVIKPLFEDVHQQLKEGDATLEKVLAEVVLRNVKELPPKRFARCMPEIFPLLSKLVSVGSAEVRQVVQDILLEQVQPLLTQAAPVTAEANGR